MSRIDDLIEDLCPNGVELKALGETGQFIRGHGLQKSDLRDDGIPAVHYGQLHTAYGVWITETKSFVEVEKSTKLRRANPGDLLIATTSEDDEAVAKATAWLGPRSVVLGGDAYIYRHVLEPKYVSYFFQSARFQNQKRRFITGAKVRRISGNSLEKVLIPVPPFEVQREIVRVLDKFTQLEAELEAELEARRAQYDYYLRDLLSFGTDDAQELCPDGVEFVTLEAVARTVSGLTGKTKADFSDGNSRYVTYKNTFSNLAVDDTASDFVKVEKDEHQNLLRFGDVVITGSSENFDEVGMSSVVVREPVEPLYLNSFCFALRFDRPILFPEFSKYLFRGEIIRKQIRKAASGVTRINVSKRRFMKIRIPVPPLEMQREIVRVLDRFTQLEAELEAELEARRKQYEYYRERLLTFKELPA